MPEFYASASREEMSLQIAKMINKHNRLYRRHTMESILAGSIDYFVELMGTKVIGCAGLLEDYPGEMSKIVHVCTDPLYRGKGIASRLVELAASNCETPYIYMTIRDDNTPSLGMAQKLGFVFVRRHWSRDHYVITVGRRRVYHASGIRYSTEERMQDQVLHC